MENTGKTLINLDNLILAEITEIRNSPDCQIIYYFKNDIRIWREFNNLKKAKASLASIRDSVSRFIYI